MDNLFFIEFNGRFIKSYVLRTRAEYAFQRYMHLITGNDVLRMIGLPSGHCYCSNE